MVTDSIKWCSGNHLSTEVIRPHNEYFQTEEGHMGFLKPSISVIYLTEISPETILLRRITGWNCSTIYYYYHLKQHLAGKCETRILPSLQLERFYYFWPKIITSDFSRNKQLLKTCSRRIIKEHSEACPWLQLPSLITFRLDSFYAD